MIPFQLKLKNLFHSLVIRLAAGFIRGPDDRPLATHGEFV